MQIGCGKGRNHHVSWALEILRRANSALISAAERMRSFMEFASLG